MSKSHTQIHANSMPGNVMQQIVKIKSQQKSKSNQNCEKSSMQHFFEKDFFLEPGGVVIPQNVGPQEPMNKPAPPPPPPTRSLSLLSKARPFENLKSKIQTQSRRLKDSKTQRLKDSSKTQRTQRTQRLELRLRLKGSNSDSDTDSVLLTHRVGG